MKGTTYTKGVVLHATNWLSLLANYSDNFALPAFNQKTLPNNPVPQPRGKTEDFGAQLNLLQNRLTARIVYYQASFREGSLKGVSAGMGARWRQGTVLGYTSTNPATRQPIRSGSMTLVDANVGYRSRLKLFNRNLGWSLQLNANNLFNSDRLIPQTAAPDGSILNYRFQTPREWFVTSTFTF